MVQKENIRRRKSWRNHAIILPSFSRTPQIRWAFGDVPISYLKLFIQFSVNWKRLKRKYWWAGYCAFQLDITCGYRSYKWYSGYDNMIKVLLLLLYILSDNLTDTVKGNKAEQPQNIIETNTKHGRKEQTYTKHSNLS